MVKKTPKTHLTRRDQEGKRKNGQKRKLPKRVWKFDPLREKERIGKVKPK